VAASRGADGRLERDVDDLADEPLEILLVAQRAVDARRRHFQPLVVDLLDFQRVLQLARDPLAVLDVDAALAAVPGPVDRHAQDAPGGAFQLHHVIAKAGYGLCDEIGKCQVVSRSAKKNGR
jgi:hypothetical protein